MHNTLPGRVSRISGTQIESGARDSIDKILANETQPKLTKVQIQFKSFLEGDVQVSFEPSNRSARKADRVIIDVKVTEIKDEPFEFDGGDRVIVLDPGHGGSDAGAIGPSGVTEKYVALEVSLKARDLLTASGYQVVMTRTTDVDVAAPGVPDSTELQARVDKAPPNAALFISVHCNAFSNGKANGMETYHAPTAVQGARLARLLNEELERLGGLSNRGVKAARFYVMTHSQCPASLIELGFITNPREEQLLASDDYQQKLAQAITNAVNRYFNQGGYE
ncbi:MAG: N-acetylmuramoyl-L-alanine amidase [Selenomonadaceae bacterium]|nr:N-acetylmuramoyl-L-alanine amidase [Selenomonadaceae bacterium]MBQ4495688.1 N-acetylmuramoyl-L-alanine amidase [Selenomonadaceae bacterium]MBQ6758930.1 N-acetylmuramoyl-L-alanine amidase [Selenomonadaceae bacterium]MBR0103636.1 N-acetylmuramoyl-L-alanine amidase [Selenomonadaceae bacterium]